MILAVQEQFGYPGVDLQRTAGWRAAVFWLFIVIAPFNYPDLGQACPLRACHRDRHRVRFISFYQ